MTCFSSNKTTTNMSCRVRPISRKVNTLNLQFFFLKEMRNLYVTVECHHQPLIGGNFVKFATHKDLNICELPRTFNPIMKGLVSFFNETFMNGAMQDKCPYGPGWFRIQSATYSPGDGIFKYGIAQSYPNGVYRNHIRVFNKRDDNIASISVFNLFSNRQNTLNGDEKI